MSQEKLDQAISLSRSGHKNESRQLLVQIVKSEPHNEIAWFWLVDTFPTQAERIGVLEECLRQNPSSGKVRQVLESLKQERQLSTLKNADNTSATPIPSGEIITPTDIGGDSKSSESEVGLDDRTGWKCGRCGRFNIGVVVCTGCGISFDQNLRLIDDSKPCPNCGNLNPSWAAGCSKCGRDFTKKLTIPSDATTPSASSSSSLGLKTNIIMWGIFGGIVLILFLVAYYIGQTPDPKKTEASICGTIMCISLCGLVILIVIRKPENREQLVQKAFTGQTTQNQIYGSTKTISGRCRSCGHSVSRTAPICPNCGLTYPGLVTGCPHCGSTNVRIEQKGFSLGKAAAGTLAVGPVGALGGMHGRKDLELICMDCHKTLTIKNNEIR